mmetsp:Transcript_32524/g.103713  ORF Transcript_32524/g.103713 Transcript_32524/m.103713 type:complete len:308 (+) Transcript_32524:671-1594(+)
MAFAASSTAAASTPPATRTSPRSFVVRRRDQSKRWPVPPPAVSTRTAWQSSLMIGRLSVSSTAWTTRRWGPTFDAKASSSSPWSWTRSTPVSSMILRMSSRGWFWTTATVSGRPRAVARRRFAFFWARVTEPDGGGVHLEFRSPNLRMASTIVAPVSVDRHRFDAGAKTMPIKSAPRRAASTASSAEQTPQTLARSRRSAESSTEASSSSDPSKVLTAARLSAARMRVSPTRTEQTPAVSTRSTTSARVATPDRDARATTSLRSCGGIIFARRAVAVMSSWKVWRLRLLTPRTRAPLFKASSISLSL